MNRIWFFMVLLLSATACVDRGNNNERDTSSNTIDTEEPQEIPDNNEFTEAFTTSAEFPNWDTNNDDKVNENELYQQYFAMIDANDDKKLSKEELDNGVGSFFGANGKLNHGDFSKWDKNGDGSVSEDEFYQYLKDEKFFEDWDKNGDGHIDEKEFAEASFTMWDEAKYVEWRNKVDEAI